VPNRFRDFPLYSIPIGGLDDEPQIEVVVQIYMASKAHWEKERLAGLQFAEMPPLEEMFRLLHIGHGP
jgi:hypothetical protein